MIKRFLVQGHSMMPTLKEGDWILVKTWLNIFKPGNVVVLKKNNKSIIKRIIKTNNKNLTVCGDSSCQKPFTVRRNQLIGKFIIRI